MLEESPYPCLVLSHQSLERGHSKGGWSIQNSAEVRALFAEVNARHPGRVHMTAFGGER